MKNFRLTYLNKPCFAGSGCTPEPKCPTAGARVENEAAEAVGNLFIPGGFDGISVGDFFFGGQLVFPAKPYESGLKRFNGLQLPF